MKKSIQFLFAVAVSLCINFHSLAQGFELSVNSGLAIPTAGSYIPNFLDIDAAGNQTALITTGGAGVNLGVTLGYNFNKYVGLHLNVNQLFGLKGDFKPYPATVSFQGGGTSFNPLVKVTAFNENKVNFYTKFGLLFMIAKADSEVTIPSVPGSAKYEYRGNIAKGWLAGFGVDIKASEKMKLFVEFETRMSTWAPATNTNVANFTGAPLEPELQYDQDVAAGSDPLTKQITLSIPVNSFALNVGVAFNFNNQAD